MNGNLDLLSEMFRGLKPFREKNEIILCVPFPFLGFLSQKFELPFQRGAQDCSMYDQGAYTGEVSARQLSEFQCSYVIVGHSERRNRFSETDQDVNSKASQALKNNLIPIICVGEEKAGETDALKEQVEGSCRGLSGFWLAYEPVWAIGSGKTPSFMDIEETCKDLKEILPLHTPVVYGGSVNESNAKSILGLPSVDGVLLGNASLNLESLASILKQAQEVEWKKL